MFGHWEILIVLVIILVVFGAGKLPKVMGDLGKGISSFKKGMGEGQAAEETKAEDVKEVAEVEKVKKTAKPAVKKKPASKAKKAAKSKPASKKSK